MSSLKGLVRHSTSEKNDVTGFCGMLKFFVSVVTFLDGSFIISMTLSLKIVTETATPRDGFDLRLPGYKLNPITLSSEEAMEKIMSEG